MKSLLMQQWDDFWKLNPAKRRWEMPFVAAMASGVPLFIGAYFQHVEYGLVSSLGGMTFLYMPHTKLAHRIVFMLCAASCMTTSFLFGLVAHHFLHLMVPLITVLTFALTLMSRYFRIAPPGNLFFLMAAMIAAYMPLPVDHIPYQVGLLFMGALMACILGLFYTLYLMARGVPEQPIMPVEQDMELVVSDSVIVALFVGASLLLAQILDMPRPYWVPVSCIAVLQGINFRAVWSKQLHRITGTALGVVLAWGLLSLHMNVWYMCLTMMTLSTLIEFVVVRHYAFAVVFITPLTIFLAEAGNPGMVNEVIAARLWDTLLGSAMGLLGGYCLHQLGLRHWLSHRLHVMRG